MHHLRLYLLLLGLTGCLPALDEDCDCPPLGYRCVAGACLPLGDGAPPGDGGAGDAARLPDGAPGRDAAPDPGRDAAPDRDAGRDPDAGPDPDAASDPDTGPDPDAAPDPDAEPDRGPICEPAPEACNGLDDDCDGPVDEDTDRPCGPLEQDGVGPCRAGVLRCVEGRAEVCVGAVEPGFEICDGADNDCDGAIDEAADCACEPLSARDCYSGPPGTVGQGPCVAGRQACRADGAGYGACVGEVTPAAETCNERDDDCNGLVDDVPGRGQPCDVGIGACRVFGTVACVEGEPVPRCDAVAGQPGAERCNALDDDCDGRIDEGFRVGERCEQLVGQCLRGGEIVCAEDGGVRCELDPAGGPEICNGRDDDCDGAIDEGDLCPGAGPNQIGVCEAQCRYACEPRWFDVDQDGANGCERGCGPLVAADRRIDGAALDLWIDIQADGGVTRVIQAGSNGLTAWHEEDANILASAQSRWDYPSIADNGAGAAFVSRRFDAQTRHVQLGRIANGVRLTDYTYDEVGIPAVVTASRGVQATFAMAFVGYDRAIDINNLVLLGGVRLLTFQVQDNLPMPVLLPGTGAWLHETDAGPLGVGLVSLGAGRLAVAGFVARIAGGVDLRLERTGAQGGSTSVALPGFTPTGRVSMAHGGGELLITTEGVDGTTLIAAATSADGVFSVARLQDLGLAEPMVVASPRGFLLVGISHQDLRPRVFLLDGAGAIQAGPLPLIEGLADRIRVAAGPDGTLWIAWSEGADTFVGDTGCR